VNGTAWFLLVIVCLLVISLGIALFGRFHPAAAPSVNVGIDPVLHEQQLKALRDDYDNLLSQVRDDEANFELRWQEREAEWSRQMDEFRHGVELEYTAKKRADAKLTAQRSRTALVAKIAEHMAPYLAGFPYDPKNARHWGEVFDFLVYDGLEESGGERIETVIFLEVKTKRSGPRVTNKRERALREALKAGRVRYEVWVPDVSEAKEIEP
jgi:predicted Holliday junction resolvase-like endonuclease